MIHEMIFLYLKCCFTNCQDKYIQTVKHFFTTKSPCLISCSQLVGWLVRISVTFSFFIVPKSLSSFSFFIVPKLVINFYILIVLFIIYHLLPFSLRQNFVHLHLFHCAKKEFHHFHFAKTVYHFLVF